MKVEDDPAPTVRIAPKKPDLLPVNSAPVIPKQAVKTNVFSTGSSAAPTIARAPSQVQTGGFGDPNGIPAKASQGKAVNIAARGSFDLPSGPGYGNGTGGAKGVPGVVVSSGFGNGTATPDNRPRARRGSARRFRRCRCSGRAHRTLSSGRSQRPGQSRRKSFPSRLPSILKKPAVCGFKAKFSWKSFWRPPAASASCALCSGLGHGLDDNAVKAAEQIHFKPAMRDGQPTDSTVVLHIIFQLA